VPEGEAVRRALTAVAALVALGVPATAQGAVANNLFNVRYCEILEAKGPLPDVVVTVWNTIGYSLCPPKWWATIDGQKIAKERDDLLVLLNGPRHWLMDKAVGNPLGTDTFNGQKMHKLATISLHGADALKQRLYFDRTITRKNVWTWNKGRRIYELVAPGGDRYIMQAYSQIIDKKLSLKDLPGLAKRLSLPDGWSYHTRVLTKPFVLRAKGSATVAQDDFQNTYQLYKATKPAGPATERDLDIHGATKTVKFGAGGFVEDRGTITGAPFGDGTIDLQGTLADNKLDGTFRILLSDGSVIGTVSAPFTTSGNEIDFVGTGTLIGGTGAYRGITSGTLDIHDHNTLDGQNGVFEAKGSATY